MADEVTVTTVENPTGTDTTVVEPAVAEAVAGALASASEHAVEVAQIEADRDVALAEIHSEAATEQVEAQAKAQVQAAEAIAEGNEGLEECRRNIASQQTELTSIRETLQSIQAKLEATEMEPPQSPEPESVVVEDLPAAETAPEAPPKPKPRSRWI